MTDNQSDNQNDQTSTPAGVQDPVDDVTRADVYADGWRRAHADAVRALTAAARLRRPSFRAAGDGAGPRDEPMDFAEFVAQVLAAVAANLGSTSRLIAGRPGSWEADLVEQLVSNTVGEDGEYLFEHRTEPVVVPLSVHDLMAEQASGPGYLTPYEVEMKPVDEWLSAAYERQLDDADSEDSEGGQQEYEQAEAAWAEIEQRWGDSYGAYAAAFTTAVTQEAARIGVPVPVEVIANTAADGTGNNPALYRVHNPDPYAEDADQLVWRLWEHAHTTVPLPAGTTPDPKQDPTTDGDQS